MHQSNIRKRYIHNMHIFQSKHTHTHIVYTIIHRFYIFYQQITVVDVRQLGKDSHYASLSQSLYFMHKIVHLLYVCTRHISLLKNNEVLLYRYIYQGWVDRLKAYSCNLQIKNAFAAFLDASSLTSYHVNPHSHTFGLHPGVLAYYHTYLREAIYSDQFFFSKMIYCYGNKNKI